MTTPNPQALPELPPADWYACSTPGADFDTSFVRTMPEALELAGDVSSITPLISAQRVLAALAQPPAEPVPEGWRLVPTEPTDAMVDATYHGQPLADIWRDMIAAAPTQPPSPQPEPAKAPKRCAAGRDGDCIHALCPQNRDGEPAKSGRHCPLDVSENDE